MYLCVEKTVKLVLKTNFKVYMYLCLFYGDVFYMLTVWFFELQHSLGTGLHLQAFELFFRESQPSASMSPILLKTVFIKDSYKKIASNSTAMHS